jgi:primosomal protein N' (replication factor Y)
VKALKNTTPNEKHQSVLALLEPYSQGLPVAEVCRQLSISPSVINTMARNGLVSLEKRPVFRNPLNHAVSEIKEASRHPLTEAQSEIVDAVLTMEPACEPQLLYGVTGSGKTEVYMALTEAVTATGRAVLLMVPEIALTSQIARRFIERFGMEHIALWHSNISPGEKLDTWRRLQSGELKILVGARSAIFGPLKDIGLIILDEEHDGSYKQDSPAPRYHARTLAVELAKRHNARLLLGSATPDLTDFTQACASGRMHHLASRFGQSGMAEVSILDMRPFIGSATSGIVSQPLRQALEDTLARQEQAIILINRRGFYTTLSCGRCHYFFQCPHCDVLLTVHKISGHVRCHYCGYEQETPQYCPQCAGMTLAQSGVGTQRVEHELNSAFPEARIVRLDTDILRRKGAFAEILQSFGDGKIDILVGTQMVAKGLDFENVTLVGVINSDASFNMPDYKSSERGFQLLTQVAGRAGRGSKKGQVLIQSLDPEHPVIQYAKQQDFDGFYKYEMLVRERLGFPPFGELFRFIVSGKDEIRTRHFIRAATLNLQQQIEDEGLAPYMEILGPASCMIGRIEDRYRFHVLVKSKADGDQAHSLISRFFRSVTPPDEINFILDVEPQSLL